MPSFIVKSNSAVSAEPLLHSNNVGGVVTAGNGLTIKLKELVVLHPVALFLIFIQICSGLVAFGYKLSKGLV